MKYIAIFFSFIVSFIVCSTQLGNPRCDIIRNFSDSITSIVDNKEFLYYIRGHHGHIWSLVVPDKNRYILVSGNTRNNDCRIDTVSLHAPVLKWGLDTMTFYCHNMKQLEDMSYEPFFYERLVLFSPQKEVIFDCTNTDAYCSPDSAIFNTKLNNLKYLMYWIAVPIEIRERLPSPL